MNAKPLSLSNQPFPYLELLSISYGNLRAVTFPGRIF